MATLVSRAADINPDLAASAKLVAHDINPIAVGRADEDDSSLSSANTEIFDRNEAVLTHPGHDNSGWRRYGSLESAASTGVTSMCSSNSMEGTPSEQLGMLTPSKKRMLDGTIKIPALRLNSKRNTPLHTPTSSKKPSQTHEQWVERMPKRRGRPPKDEANVDGTASKARRASTVSKLQNVARPRSSIPSSVSVGVFANQCIEAAIASRLNPYSLHPGEHELLVDSITSAEATIYLNIRNAILRLWTRNPLCSVTPEEAAGCAKEGRFFGLAEVAYKWLVRNGYINFGCVEVQKEAKVAIQAKNLIKQRTVVVIGAGVAGLTTARQLENLFAHAQEHWLEQGERPPRVIVLEGRKRIGGRVYSKPLRSYVDQSLPGGLRNTAEMGAMIVTGFERGNPLDVVIRGQLGLRYHLLTDALTIYDCDGVPVNDEKDMLNTDLYTDISDRTGEFRATPQQRETLRGDEDLINRCRDPAQNGLAAFQLEPLSEPLDAMKQRKPVSKRGRRRNAPPGTEKLTGRSQIVGGGSATIRAARAAHQMGWQVREGVSKNHTVSLRAIADAHDHPSLGTVMDAAISQYQGLLEFAPQDMRLLNWHHANLEYANAAPVTWLSLSGHDQDNGNEFEGAHSEIIGGYTQLPRGLMNLPTKLDVRFDHAVESIHYAGSDDDADEKDELITRIVCTNGEIIEAEEIVVTAPLGVLKSDMIDFDPPLPRWKQGAIDRMGFGLLNKVVLLYDSPFWAESRDMFGLLNEAEEKDSLDPKHYEARRGRFYLIWNASKISGRPMLVALMAGHAAYQAEATETSTLLSEITERLRKTFSSAIPAPREVIVTRWKQDPFSRGTYSYVAPRTQSEDYDLMAKSVGNLHFAGEATCGTHPATVHGAFLSGLRVASEVLDAMVGDITLPLPLVGPPPVKQEASTPSVAARPPTATQSSSRSGRPANAFGSPMASLRGPIKFETDSTALASDLWSDARKTGGPPAKSVCSTDPSFWASPSFDNSDLSHEANIAGLTLSQIGERPTKPNRPGVNPFLLYTKTKWEECKAYCSGSSDHVAGRNMIRQTLGQWWKALSEAEKQPYLEQSRAAQESADAERKEWADKVAKWDEASKRIRREYAHDHVHTTMGGAGSGGGAFEGMAGSIAASSRRKTNVSTNVALDLSAS